MEPGHVRLAEPAPPYCSACFQQKPHMRHVDMGAAWDGPVVPALEGAIGVVGHTIDDLILCEDCLTLAGNLVGLSRNDELQAANVQLEAANSELHAKLALIETQQAAIEKLRESLGPAGVTIVESEDVPPGWVGLGSPSPVIKPGPPPGARGRQKGRKRAAAKPTARTA